MRVLRTRRHLRQTLAVQSVSFDLKMTYMLNVYARSDMRWGRMACRHITFKRADGDLTYLQYLSQRMR